jgi:hypothetical protein
MIFKTSKLRHIFLAILTTMAPVAAYSDQLMVGSCPTPIEIEKKGEWYGVKNDPDMLVILRANPNETRDVAGIYVAARHIDNNRNIV